jgi:hypothetical protein
MSGIWERRAGTHFELEVSVGPDSIECATLELSLNEEKGVQTCSALEGLLESSS